MDIVIAGNDPIARSALTGLLQVKSNLNVIDEAATASDLFTLVEQCHIDLVLLDGQLTDQPSSDVINNLKQLEKPPVVLALDVRPEMEMNAITAGADAFVYKGDDPKKLLIAIEKVRHKHENRFDPNPPE